MNRLLIALLILLTPASAFAGNAEGVMQLRVAPAALNTGKAYLLFQSSHAKSGMNRPGIVGGPNS